MNVAEQLEYAAAEIESGGWWSGDDASAGGTTSCPVTALRSVRGEKWAAHDALVEFINGRDHGFVVSSIYNWNDAPGQTKENVIATMRACAAIWRAKHEETRSAVPALGVESELAR